MRWLSIDPGFTRLGYALWDEDTLIESGVEGPPSRDKVQTWHDWMDSGIIIFTHWINKLVKNLEYVRFEQLPLTSGPGFGSSPQVPLVFTALGAIKSVLTLNEIEWEEVHSAHWKKTLFGDIKISKAVTRRKIVELYPIIKKDRKLGDIPFDQTDAIAIGLAWIYEKKPEQNSKAQSLKRSL